MPTLLDTNISIDHVSILDKSLVLVLNKSWIAIAVTTPRKAVVAMMGGDDGHPVCALDLQLDPEGNLEYADPVDWDLWKTLSVREDDLYIQTANGRVRAPTVLITKHFNKVPLKKPRLSVGTLRVRDNDTCGYTGKKLKRSQITIDHIMPRSRGGRDTWTNLIICDREVNTMKADRTPQEAGLRLLRQPKEPPSLPASSTIGEVKHGDWRPFLIGKTG